MRYFFHYLSDDERLDDTLGIEHAEVDEARAEAVRAAREMIAESLRRDLLVPDESVIEITDERGRLVDQVSLLAAAFGDMADQRYRRIFDAAPQGCLLLTAGLVIVDANAAFLRARQTDRAAIAGRLLSDVFRDQPGAADGGACNLMASLQTVLRTKVAHEVAVQRHDLRRDGGWEERYWRLRNIPLLDADGEVEFIVHQVEDVTGAHLGARMPRRAINRPNRPAPSALPPAGRVGH